MSGQSSDASVAGDLGQTYDVPPRRQAVEVETSYDTPRSTRAWDTSRPNSVAIDGTVYDSPRSTKAKSSEFG